MITMTEYLARWIPPDTAAELVRKYGNDWSNHVQPKDYALHALGFNKDDAFRTAQEIADENETSVWVGHRGEGNENQSFVFLRSFLPSHLIGDSEQ